MSPSLIRRMSAPTAATPCPAKEIFPPPTNTRSLVETCAVDPVVISNGAEPKTKIVVSAVEARLAKLPPRSIDTPSIENSKAVGPPRIRSPPDDVTIPTRPVSLATPPTNSTPPSTVMIIAPSLPPASVSLIWPGEVRVTKAGAVNTSAAPSSPVTVAKTGAPVAPSKETSSPTVV